MILFVVGFDNFIDRAISERLYPDANINTIVLSLLLNIARRSLRSIIIVDASMKEIS